MVTRQADIPLLSWMWLEQHWRHVHSHRADGSIALVPIAKNPTSIIQGAKLARSYLYIIFFWPPELGHAQLEIVVELKAVVASSSYLCQ